MYPVARETEAGREKLSFISHLHRLATPLTYPTLFPHGTPGWARGEYEYAEKVGGRTHTTAQELLRYRMFERDPRGAVGIGEDGHLFHGRGTQK